MLYLFIGGNAIAIPGGYYSLDQGRTLLSSVSCTGNEASILDCVNTSLIGSKTCTNKYNVGVICPISGILYYNVLLLDCVL